MSESHLTESDDFRDLVRDCFSSVLKRNDFDDTTDFFALGGDSLGATTILMRISESTGRSLSVEHFFQNPTVELLAALVRTSAAAGSDNTLDDLVDDLSDLDDEALARLLQ